MLPSEIWATRLNSIMEYGPWNLPISHKMQSQPCFSIKNVNDSQAWAQVIQINWRPPSGMMPENQGNASSGMTPLPPVSKGAPRGRNKPLDVLVDVVASSCFSTVVAPIERVKLLMQSQNALIQSGRLSKPYKGIFDCFAVTIRNEGVISLWRGNTARVIGHCFPKVIVVASSSYASYAKSPNGKSDYSGLLAFGGFSAAYLLFNHPFTYAGIRLANDVKTTAKVGKWKFGGMIDVCRQTMRSDGIRGLYRGYIVGFITNTVNSTLSLALKRGQLLQSLGLQNNHLASTMVKVALSGFISMATYPMDTVSKRMMMTSGEAIKFNNTSDAFSKIFKKEGVKAFYRGAGAEMLQIAALYVVFEFVQYLVRTTAAAKDDGSRGGDQHTSRLRIRWSKDKREEV